jgi:hypothetical protein
VPLFRNAGVFVFVAMCASTVFAQDREAGSWEPIGPVPVDQAGAGRRGYSLAAESAGVAEPRTSQIAFHMVGANNFYVERTDAFQISQRSETHTLAFEYRRGFKAGRLPRFEIGAQIQISETDSGMLNGFISGFEDFVHAPLRSRTTVAPPLGTLVVNDGRQIYQSEGAGSGLGDVYLVAKAAILDPPAASRKTRLSARVAVNLSGTSDFTEGNFVGAGLSLDRKLTGRIALHGDVRASVTMDRVSTWGLPLTRGVAAFSAGPELRLTRATSMNLQWDGSTSPYLPTGTTALDSAYGDVAFGLNHRFIRGRRLFVTQLYARENMILPFSVRWNTDPDLAVGLKVRIY